MRGDQVTTTKKMTDAAVQSAHKTAVRAAKRFAIAYAALDWKWGLGEGDSAVSYVPRDVDILRTLLTMFGSAKERFESGEEGISWSTGGLHALVTDDEVNFVMTVDMPSFGKVTK